MIPINAKQVPALYRQSMQRMAQGDLDGARRGFSQILTANSKIAEVHFQLGRICAAQSQLGQAVKHFDAALRLKPAEPAIWSQMSDALLGLGDVEKTRTFLAAAKKAGLKRELLIAIQDKLSKKPSRSRAAIGGADPARIKAAIEALNSGQPARAEQIATELRRAFPDIAIIADIRASAMASQGRHEAAAREYQDAIRLDPAYAEAHLNFGRLLLDMGRTDDALARLRRAHDLLPGSAPARFLLADALGRKGELAEAERLLVALTESDPDMVQAWDRLGSLRLEPGRFHLAIEPLERVLALTSDDRARVLTNLGMAHAGLGDEDRALELFEQAIDLEPDLGSAYARKGALLQTQGDFEGAEALFRQAIDRAPLSGEFFKLLVTSRKMTREDPLITRMEAAWDDPDLPDSERADLGFALSKTMEDIKAYDRAFPYLARANALVRGRFPYDIEERRRELSALRAAFEGVDFNRPAIAGASDYAPIFVTGMPRSGTTLVEQIIASHSHVSGGGELGYLTGASKGFLTRSGAGTLRALSGVSDDEIAALGHHYVQKLNAGFPSARHVTDKTIQTYTILGLARLALPRARFIVVRRDPRDNLLSIYRNQFTKGRHRYAYDLRDLGLYWRLFDEQVAFWRERLPGGFYEITYEDLIADPDTQVRQLISACGLDWEDSCLNFHENTRSVKTLSLYQVRQPIYKSSMKAWQRYEKDLGPLFRALEEGL